MFTMQYTKDGGRRGGGKKDHAKPCTKGRGVSYGKIGLTTVAVTQDLPSGMLLILMTNRSTN